MYVHQQARSDHHGTYIRTLVGIPADLLQTPYFASTLPGPAKLIDPNLNLEYPMHAVNKASKARKSQAAEDLEDIDMDNDTPIPGQNEAGPSNWAKLARPKSGEVRWWVNGFDVDRDGNKDRIYLWNDIGGQCFSWSFYLRVKIAEYTQQTNTALF